MNLKDEKGSITIFVLVGLLFMSAFLIILYASNVNKSKIVDEQFDIINAIYLPTDSTEESYIDALGRYFPNTPMLAAIVKISGVMTDEELLEDMKSSFKHKFAKKPEVIEGNMKALEMALQEVKQIN